MPRVTAYTLATALEGVQEGPIASGGSPPPGSLVLAGPSVGRENSSVRPVSSVDASTTVHSGVSIATGTASSVVPVNTTMSSTPTPAPVVASASSGARGSMSSRGLPLIAQFSGDSTEDIETFPEWLEQFDMVVAAAGWTDQFKLPNLVMRLKGPARAFYKTCSQEQRNSLPQLVAELSKRFVPVSQSRVIDSIGVARRRGRPWTNMPKNFISCAKRLIPKSHRRVLAEEEGDFERQLCRARFEEAKIRDLRPPAAREMKSQGDSPRSMDRDPSRGLRSAPNQGSQPPSLDHIKCHKCGLFGHYQRNCRYVSSSKYNEARGRTEKTTKSVAAVVPAEPPAPVPTEVGTLGQRLEATRKQLRELEVEAAAKRPAATLHGLTTLKGELGPTVTATVHINGVPTEALIDTGSPSTIVSL